MCRVFVTPRGLLVMAGGDVQLGCVGVGVGECVCGCGYVGVCV